MKFDLEMNITDVLTQTGKDKLAEIFFPIDISLLTGRFDQTLINYAIPIDTKKFNIIDYTKYTTIDPTFIKSRVLNQGDLSLSKVLIKRGNLIPFFNQGTLLFNNYPITFSNDSVRLLMEYDTDFDRYFIKIPKTTDTASIRIITSKVASGGLNEIDTEFTFISETQAKVIISDNVTAGKFAPNTIIIEYSNAAVTGIYSTQYSNIPSKICDFNKIITGDFDIVKSSMSDGNVFVDQTNQLVIIKNDNKFYNLRHKTLFNRSKIDNLYTISTVNGEKIIYLNCNKLTYTEQITDSVPNNKSVIKFFNKYPIINIQNNFTTGYPGSNWSVQKSKNWVRFTNSSGSIVPVNELLTGQLYPVISYNRGIIDTVKNIKHVKVDISPKSVNFGDGILCFSNAEVNKSNIVENIEIDNGDNLIAPMSSKAITVKLTNADGIPLANKPVTLTLTTNPSDIVKWGTSTTPIVSGNTNLSGEFKTTLISSNIKDTYFIPKEWVGDIVSHDASSFTRTADTFNKVYLPLDLTGVTVNDVFMFIITADDPITGQIVDKGGLFGITSEFFTSPKPFDYYAKNDINTYELSGRRIAYVEISAQQEIGSTGKYTIGSSFKRPSSISITNSEKEFFGKKLFIYNSLIPTYSDTSSFPNILTEVNSTFTKVAASDFTINSQASSAFDSKWLLSINTFDYFKFTVPKFTTITYNDQLPGLNDNNIIGFLIRVKRSNVFVKFKAEHTDGFVGTTLSQDSVDIYSDVPIEMNSTFTLSTDTNNINSYIGPYSHLTLSDYMSSQYGTNYSTYVCSHSTRVLSNVAAGNRCSNPTLSTRDYYVAGPDSQSNLYCKHNIDYDKTLLTYTGTQDKTLCKCPGLNAQLINPFLFYTSS